MKQGQADKDAVSIKGSVMISASSPATSNRDGWSMQQAMGPAFGGPRGHRDPREVETSREHGGFYRPAIGR